jgi:hypothetical protein
MTTLDRCTCYLFTHDRLNLIPDRLGRLNAGLYEYLLRPPEATTASCHPDDHLTLIPGRLLRLTAWCLTA